MDAPEGWRQKAIDAGDEGNSRQRGEIRSDASEIRHANQQRDRGPEASPTDALGAAGDGLHDAFEAVDRWPRRQHPDGPQNVSSSDYETSSDQPTRNRVPRVFDLVAHERR